ncbi:hypothetical protein MNBD_GAMMA10-3189 [hydrothermal vent metagenome]|uniref:Lipoprotein n=1 Tax=hydrothermal vent metagenome TaxID=652676 RepID=A0A3B0XQC1_9ZZZZ
MMRIDDRSILKFGVLCLPVVYSVALLSCAYQPPKGQWLTLDAKSLYLQDVAFAQDAKQSNYREVCADARDDIQQKLLAGLSVRAKPLPLYSSHKLPANLSKGNSRANVQVLISQCQVEVQQWGGASFTFYLSFDLQISVTQREKILLDYSIKTFEQVTTDTPSPAFEFSFEEAIARTLLLFDGGRLLIPDVGPDVGPVGSLLRVGCLCSSGVLKAYCS